MDPEKTTAAADTKATYYELPVQIAKFVDDSFPGWVKCELVDAEGRKHEFVDKYPYFTAEMLDENSCYPVSGSIACEALFQWEDDQQRKLTRVSTAGPSPIESTEGLSEFVVLSESLHRPA